MTGTSTAGADWKGGGEIKALRRIVGGSAEEDEAALAPIGHNLPPQATVHESTAAEIALEEQAGVVERALEQSDGAAERTGRELIILRAKFCAVEFEKQGYILRLREGGMSVQHIAAQVGAGDDTVRRHIRAAASGREVGISFQEKGRFMKWAVARFGKPNNTLRHCMAFAEHPERLRKSRYQSAKKYKETKHLAALARARETENVAPSVFKSAFLALGAPFRTAVALWIISLEAGSDDPQEVARWFAAHQLR